jgi:branched-subunit amino acid transport protein
MDERMIWTTIVGMAVVTALLRTLPVFLLAGRSLSPFLQSCLKYLPVAVLSAMVVQEIFLQNGRVLLSAQNPFLWASLPTFLTAGITKNTLKTLTVGILSLAVLRQFFF